MTYIEEYYNKIMSGEIVACHRIKQVYSMLVDKLHHPEKYEPYIFDEELANLPIEFIETFIKQAQGELGANLKLELFQKAKHQAVFGFVHKDTYLRQYNEVLDIRGRKMVRLQNLQQTKYLWQLEMKKVHQKYIMLLQN